ncbi:MAG: hypothetical protein DMF49_11485 [Acidobacteria bacterium]|nr:MAG: hypothetical protein DMF49_11485 [Acidobacteriota bacterium]
MSVQVTQRPGRSRGGWPARLRVLGLALLFVTPFLAVAGAQAVGQDRRSGTGAHSVLGGSQDVVAMARALARSGQRRASLEMLQRRLAEAPDDEDARTLYGTVLSWEGRYDEARKELERVLQRRPDNGDALPALINVELWSGNPERAEALSRDGLARHADDSGLTYQHARALHALGREKEALVDLDRFDHLQPGDPQASKLRKGIQEGLASWQVRFFNSNDWFSNGQDTWHETGVALKRATPVGSVIGRYSHANRFGQADDMGEIDFYPSLAKGVYGFLNAGYSPGYGIYPHYRLMGDIYADFGPGVEASAGYRRLGFRSGVDVYTGSIGKYWSNWLFTGRVYLTPGDGKRCELSSEPCSVGTSHSYFLSGRRFLGGGTDYFELRYGHGASKEEIRTIEEIGVLGSKSFFSELYLTVRPSWGIDLTGGYAREERLVQGRVRKTTLGAAAFLKF